MRFEELSYREDGLPVSVPFHARLTVVGPLGGRARAGWILRALGALHGTRPGDGTGLTFRDHAGRRVRLERDRHGAARMTDVGSGADLTTAAGDLPLDGRLDWFASVGLDIAGARALICLGPADFKDDDVNPWDIEDELGEARAELDRVEAEHATVLARAYEVEELRRRVLELDDWLIRMEERRARRLHGEILEAVCRLEARRAAQLQAVAAERRAADAVLAAADAARDWRHALAALEVAQHAFGDRPPPALPLHERAAPESRTARGGNDLHAELDEAHRELEAAERELERVRLPRLAMAARRRLARAQQREQAVLEQMGFRSWLAVEMQRVDLLREPAPAAVEPTGAVDDHDHHDADDAAAVARDARLRRTLVEADAAARAARARLEAVLAGAGLSPEDSGDLEAVAAAVTARVREATAHRRTPPTAPALRETEIELAAAREALAAFGHPEWEDDHVPDGSGDTDGPPDDEPLPDPEPLLAERARLFEDAYHLERTLPDVRPLEDRREAVARRIEHLERASRLGYELLSGEASEMVVLDHVARASEVGPAGEPVPVLVDDAFADFDPDDHLDLLHLLARLAEVTQVVYLTGDPTTLEWAAAQATAGDALVVRPAAVPPSVASVA